MLIKFHPPASLGQETVEWALDVIPRVGDTIYFGPGDSAEVRSVMWVLGDDDGKALRTPCVDIYLR